MYITNRPIIIYRANTVFSGILIDPYGSLDSTKMTVIWNMEPHGSIMNVPESIISYIESLMVEKWMASLETEYRRRRK